MEPDNELQTLLTAPLRRRLVNYVSSLLRRLLGRSENPGYAEDIVSEACAAAHQHFGYFDPERGAFEPWLMQIARNKMYDYLRKAGEYKSEISFEEAGVDPERNAQACTLLYEKDAQPTPKTLALQRALKRLSRYDQELLMCRFGHGLTYEEIEGYFNFALKKATLRVHVNRAQARLRKELVRYPEFAELLELAYEKG